MPAIRLDLTVTGYGIIALIIFVLACLLVTGEEFLHLRKSKPVIIAACIIWGLVGGGGSLLSIGSAAGAALIRQARGVYTFFAHLKWSWAMPPESGCTS